MEELWQVAPPIIMTQQNPRLRLFWTEYDIQIMGYFIWRKHSINTCGGTLAGYSTNFRLQLDPHQLNFLQVEVWNLQFLGDISNQNQLLQAWSTHQDFRQTDMW